jgi:hypothetical protein
MTTFYCLILDYTNLEGQVPAFISRRNRVTQLHPRGLGSLFVASYDSQGYDGGILSNPVNFLDFWHNKVKVTLRLTVSQSVCLDVELLLDLMTRCLLMFDGYCCLCGAPSLSKGRVCRLSESAFLNSPIALFVASRGGPQIKRLFHYS